MLLPFFLLSIFFSTTNPQFNLTISSYTTKYTRDKIDLLSLVNKFIMKTTLGLYRKQFLVMCPFYDTFQMCNFYTDIGTEE